MTIFKALETFILTLATGSFDIGIKIGVIVFERASGDKRFPTCYGGLLGKWNKISGLLE